MSRRLSATAAVTVLVWLVWAGSALAGPGMGWGQWTSPDLTFAQCMTRTEAALGAQGFTTVERHGRFWFGSSTGPASVAVGCYGLARGSIVTVVVGSFVGSDGSHDSSGVVGRLHDAIFRPTAAPPPAALDGWSHDVRDFRGRNGQRFAYACAPRSQASGRLWGTDLYTDDSLPCVAAVHAGVITAAQGGTVTVEVRPGADSYVGSTRNGVPSSGYGSWGGSFVLVR